MYKTYERLNKAIGNTREKQDCPVVAVSLLCDVSYNDARIALKRVGRRKNCGISNYMGFLSVFEQFNKNLVQLNSLQVYPIKSNGNRGCYTPISIVKAFPKGKYLLITRNHAIALIDGVVQDWSVNNRLHIKKIYAVLDYD